MPKLQLLPPRIAMGQIRLLSLVQWCSTCKTVLGGKSSGPAAKALLPVLHAATFSHVILHNFAHQWVSACVDRARTSKSRICMFLVFGF